MTIYFKTTFIKGETPIVPFLTTPSSLKWKKDFQKY